MNPADEFGQLLSLFDEEDESPTLERMVEDADTAPYDANELAALLGQCLTPDAVPTLRRLP